MLVEKVAYSKGLPPEVVSVMLEFAMSLRMGRKAAVAAILSPSPFCLFNPVMLVIERNVLDNVGRCSKSNR